LRYALNTNEIEFTIFERKVLCEEVVVDPFDAVVYGSRRERQLYITGNGGSRLELGR
jgi:hypothetical protein